MFWPDKRFRWQYENDPEAQKDAVSKLEHERLAQIGANVSLRNVVENLFHVQSNDDLDLISDVVNTVNYTDDRESVMTILRAAVASINRAESE